MTTFAIHRFGRHREVAQTLSQCRKPEEASSVLAAFGRDVVNDYANWAVRFDIIGMSFPEEKEETEGAFKQVRAFAETMASDTTPSKKRSRAA